MYRLLLYDAVRVPPCQRVLPMLLAKVVDRGPIGVRIRNSNVGVRRYYAPCQLFCLIDWLRISLESSFHPPILESTTYELYLSSKYAAIPGIEPIRLLYEPRCSCVFASTKPGVPKTFDRIFPPQAFSLDSESSWCVIRL